MVTKKTGLSPDLIIHPGETILDLLKDREITQSELAKSTGVSSAYISNIISGKKGISAKFAMSLEYFFDIPKSFWLNLQANYEAELLEFNEIHSISQEEKDVMKKISNIVKHLIDNNKISPKLKLEETILELRRYFKISSLVNLKDIAGNYAFRISPKIETDPYVLGAWIKMCQNSKSDLSIDTVFDKDLIDDLVNNLKKVMCYNIDNLPELEKVLKNLLSKYGIDFSIFMNFRGAPVQGYISKTENGMYKIILTIRKSYADIFWFSLFHELGHILNGDVNVSSKFLDLEKEKNSIKENMADDFAQNTLLNKNDYSEFIEEGNFPINAISDFAKSQNVMDYIVIGRLQKEGFVNYNKFSTYKLKYKW